MFHNIIVAVDLDHTEEAAHIVEVAKNVAGFQNARLHLLNVVPAESTVVSQFLPQDYEIMAASKVQRRLEALAAQATTGPEPSTSKVRFGVVYQEILAHAEHTGADLIVIGCHQPNVVDYLLGSNAARVVRHAECSVFIVR